MKAKGKNINSITQKVSGTNTERVAIWERKYFFESLIFAFAFLLFANSIPNEYNLDDELVTINHRLTSKGISAISEIITSPYYQDESGYSYEYRPIVHITFAIEHQFFGDNPHISHFWNIFLYALCCVLLYKTLLLLFKDYSPIFSIAITLLFVAHPAHTEIVCSIKNRDEILGLGFGLLALFYSLKAFQEEKWWPLFLVPVFFTCSLLSKLTFMSFAITIPLALLLFKKFEFKKLIFTVITTLLPVVLTVGIGNALTKIFILSLGCFCIVFIYILLNSAVIKSELQKITKAIFNKNKYLYINQESSIENSLNLFENIVPKFSSFSFKYLALHIFLTAIFLVSMFYQIHSIQIFIGVILIFLTLLKNETANWLANCTIYLLTLVCAYNLKLFENSLFFEFLILPLVYTLLLGNRNLFFPTILTIFFPLLIGMKGDANLSFIAPFALFIGMYIQRFRYGWIPVVLPTILKYSSYFMDGIDNFQIFIQVQLPYIASTILLLAIYFKKQHWSISKLYLTIAFSFTLFYQAQYDNDSILIKKSLDKITTINPTVISKNENRPIDFVENCIDFVKTPISIKLGTSFEILGSYLSKVVLPFPLSFYYGYSFITPMKITETIPLASLAFHLLLFFLSLFFCKRDKRIGFGLLWYLISIAIFSNYFQAVPGMLADRFLLVPSLGWLILLVVLLQKLSGIKNNENNLSLKAIPNYTKYSFAALLFFYSAITFSRNTDWKDYLTLFKHDIKYVNNSAQAHNLLALRLMKNSYNNGINTQEQLSMHQEALLHFKRAIEIYPVFFNATYDIARVYTVLNKPDSALIYFEKAIKLNPTFSDSYMAAGEILFQQKRVEDARLKFEKIISIFPANYIGYDKVSYIYFLQKEYEKSIVVNRKAVLNIPNDPLPLISIAKAYYAMNQKDSTRVYLNYALVVSPNQQEAKGLLLNLDSK